MPHRLFVYGSLRPGGSNEHVLQDIEGRWLRGSVRGHLRERGWGAALGYPGIVLDDAGERVSGHVLVSDELEDRWEMLDDFEGPGYRRVSAPVRLEDGSTVEAWIYVLRE